MASVFTSTDGSVYKVLSAKLLSEYPIWKGNRILDEIHVTNIKQNMKDVKLLNMNPFRIAALKDDENVVHRYIIDGQHRHAILKEYFSNPDASDFEVLVAGRVFQTESEVMDYFKIINSTKSIIWKEDPVLCANQYIQALTIEFNKDIKKPMFRHGKTTRPFISIDKLRDILISKRVSNWKQTPQEFVEETILKNQQLLNGYRLKDEDSLTNMEIRAINYDFVLGLDDKFSWI